MRGGYLPVMSGERALREHLCSRIINAADTCSKIFHQQTVSCAEGREARDRAVFSGIGRARSPGGQRRAGPLPRARVGGGPGGARSLPAVTQRAPVSLRPQPDTHLGPPRPRPASGFACLSHNTVRLPGHAWPDSCGPSAGRRR